MADETQGAGTDAEKREHSRELVLIPVYVERQEVPASSLGLVRNVSVAGAYFLTQQRLKPGDSLDLTLHLSGDPAGPTQRTGATVVRIEELDLDTTDLWFYGVGVRFERELSELAEEISELARRLSEAQ